MGSSLSIKYQDLLVAVGHFLGYNPDSTVWTPGELATVDRYVQAGYRQFLYPPAVPGVDPGHEWSFLNPTESLTTESGTGSNDLPGDFSRILGGFTFDPVVFASSVVVIPYSAIQMRLQRENTNARPRFAAVVAEESDGTAEQGHKVWWWPVPDDAYELNYRYEAYAGKLDDAHPYPLGGMKMSGLLVQSCLASTESYANDERGIQWQLFSEMLVSAMVQDRKAGAQFFGQMGQPDEESFMFQNPHQSPYSLEYNGVDL